MTVVYFLIALITPIVVVSIGTANPEQFWIAQNTTEPLLIWNRGSLQSVQREGARSISIQGNSRVAIINPWHTQYRLVLYATGFGTTEGIRMMFRTTELDYAKKKHSGIVLEVTTNGIAIEQDGTLFTSTDSIKLLNSTPVRIAVEHDGACTRIAIGCTVLEPLRTSLPATEFTLIEPIGNGQLLLDNISAEGVYN